MHCVHYYIYRHPYVITSPIKNNLVVQLKDPENPSRKIKKAKLVMPTLVRELYNNLIRGVPQCTTANSRVVLSETKLRQMMPAKIGKMSERYKEMGVCIICLLMKMYQESYNQFESIGAGWLKKKDNEQPLGSPEQRKMTSNIRSYKTEANGTFFFKIQ